MAKAKKFFKRVLLKLSGEMLKGKDGFGIDPDATIEAAKRIKEAVDAGVQTAIIIGAGNIFRGLAGSRQGMDRSCADNMGMLATAMNALAMRDALESIGVKAEIQSAFAINGILKPFDQREAVRLLEEGTVVLFAVLEYAIRCRTYDVVTILRGSRSLAAETRDSGNVTA